MFGLSGTIRGFGVVGPDDVGVFALRRPVGVRRGPARRLGLLAALLASLLPAAAAPAAVPLEQRGVAIDISFTEPASAELADVDAAAALGATTVRVALDWSGLEPLRRGQYATWYLDRLDALVARAAARDVRVLLTPLRTPCWAGTVANACGRPTLAREVSLKSPRDPADYGRFTAFLAGRYGTRLAGIEVWNEPNMPSFWNERDPVGTYVRLLRATYPLVKRAAPTLPVVAGALAGSDAAFLDRLYVAGMKGSYDVLSVHPYNDGRDPAQLLDARWASATFLQGLRTIRATRDARRDTTPVWLTELGWNTSTQRGLTWLDGVTPAQQADYLRRAIAMLQDPAWGIDFTSGVFVYRLRDIGTDPANPQHNYGLMAMDRTPKPALGAVGAAFRGA